MNEQRELDLLVDITRLLKKYGPEAFERLANVLQERRLADTVATVLDKTIRARMARAETPVGYKAVRRRQRKQGLLVSKDVLLAIATEDAEKSRLLVSFWEDLQARRRLPRLRDVRDFAMDSDLPPVAGPSRDRAVSSLTEHLMTLPMERLSAIVEAAQVMESSGKGSLEAWTRVILHKDVHTSNSR